MGDGLLVQGVFIHKGTLTDVGGGCQVTEGMKIAKLVLLAAIQGIVIGLCLGSVVWLFLGISVESPTVRDVPTPARTKLVSSRPLLLVSDLMFPFPVPFPGASQGC